MSATYRLMTPPAAGAVALIQLAGDVEWALGAIGAGRIEIGRAAVRSLCGVDDGLVIRWSARAAQLTPHAGPFVVRRILQALDLAGLKPAESVNPLDEWPEAESMTEALMLRALARAASPLAIELLLDQPRRWGAWDGRTPPIGEIRRVSRVLRRLIDPPIVAAIGAPNVGKSTLLNALAGRAVSVVADEPGATRDHVGATLDLGGLVVRWIDTPGIRETGCESEQESMRLADAVIREADLVVLCIDHDGVRPELNRFGSARSRPVLRVRMRADRWAGEGLFPDADVTTSAIRGEGLSELTSAVRGVLTPGEALGWAGPVLFDETMEASMPRGGRSRT